MPLESPSVEIRKGTEEIGEIELSGAEEYRIGRSSECAIVLSDRAVSRNHARIVKIDGGFAVEDLQSTNGTNLNGGRISDSTPLNPGDVIEIGPFVIDFAREADTGHARLEEKTGHMTLHSISIDSFHAEQVSTFRGARGDQSPERMAEFLRNVDRVGQTLLAHRPLDELTQIVVDLTGEILKPDRVAVLLFDGDGNLQPKATFAKHSQKSSDIVISRTIANEAIEQRRAILTTDAMNDERFREQQSIANLQISSAMCAPVWREETVIGLLYADNQAAPLPFSEEDLRLLTLIAHLTAVKVKETESHDELQEMKRLEEELRYAAGIQQRLLPKDELERNGYRIGGANIPSREVGGDSFDIVESEDGKIWAALGDVSGKGMPAALLMASLHATFRAQVEAGFSLERIVPKLNEAIRRDAQGEKFITFFVLRLDLDSGEIDYINAGHNPPVLLRKSGEIELLEDGGLFLGIFPGAEYQVGSTSLNSGDAILVYSDGITEGRSAEDEEYGEERLITFFRERRDVRPCDFAAQTFEDVRGFCLDGDPGDDMTVLLVERD